MEGNVTFLQDISAIGSLRASSVVVGGSVTATGSITTNGSISSGSSISTTGSFTADSVTTGSIVVDSILAPKIDVLMKEEVLSGEPAGTNILVNTAYGAVKMQVRA